MSKDRKEYFKNYNREYYLKHKKEILKKQKEYQTINKEKVSERHKKYNQKIKASNSILTELEEWLEENIKSKPLQTTYFFECDGKQKSISGIELEELKKVNNKIQELKEKYK